MNKARKVELLYKRAKGQKTDETKEELLELRKYKVARGEGSFYTTKANITSYVKAVDEGCKISFFDWCMNNKKADRRRRGASEKEIAAANNESYIAIMAMGWLFWGLAIYWIFNGKATVGASAVAGAILSLVLYKTTRRNAYLTELILPLILMIGFYYLWRR